jgi:hypothetical protein
LKMLRLCTKRDQPSVTCGAEGRFLTYQSEANKTGIFTCHVQGRFGRVAASPRRLKWGLSVCSEEEVKAVGLTVFRSKTNNMSKFRILLL